MEASTAMTSAYSFEQAETAEDRGEIYERLKAERLLKYNMHHMPDPARQDWVDMTDPSQCAVWNIFENGVWCGIYYLSEGFQYSPFAHFAVWKGFRKQANAIMVAAMRHVDRVYAAPAILGLTPVKFRHMFPLLEKCGFKLLGVIPAGSIMAVHGEQKPCNVMLSVNYREVLWVKSPKP